MSTDTFRSADIISGGSHDSAVMAKFAAIMSIPAEARFQVADQSHDGSAPTVAKNFHAMLSKGGFEL